MNIAVLGTGYVGLVAGVCFADAGHQVICVDSNQDKIDTLNSGEVPFYEPGLDDLYGLNRKRMRFTTSIAEAVRAAPLCSSPSALPKCPMDRPTWSRRSAFSRRSAKPPRNRKSSC